jgi:predicted amidohydrolase YtcJ
MEDSVAARLTSYLVVFIVAATLIAGFIVRAQRDDNEGPVDLIVHNAVVFTGNPSQKNVEAVAVRANQILKVGSNREILRLQRPQTVMVDAKGAAVVPGFNDAHLHLIDGGLSLEGVDLSDAVTLDDAVGRVKAWATDHPDKPWVWGHGWTFDVDLVPTRQALDAVVSDRPVYLISEDRHAAWVNSRALKLARIARRTADPENGHIARDRKGEPTGILEGRAAERVAALLPKPSQADRMRALLNAITQAQQLGITSVQTPAADIPELEMFDTVRRDGTIDMRLYPALSVGPGLGDAEIAKLDPVLVKYSDDPLMKSGAAAVPVEGVDPDGLNRLVRLLDGRGWQISIEAESDTDVEKAATAFAHARRSNTAVVRERRHRLEHRSGVYTEIGETRAIGSDWPRGPLAPMRVLQTALAEHALKDALRAYTFGGAYASFDEKRKGTLEAGMLADIVVLSANIFRMEPADLDTVRVRYTIFDGRIVYPIERRTTTTFP